VVEAAQRRREACFAADDARSAAWNVGLEVRRGGVADSVHAIWHLIRGGEGICEQLRGGVSGCDCGANQSY